MRTALAACTSVLLIAAAPLAQSRPPNLSGRWQLVEPTAAERAPDTLVITSPDQLLMTDRSRQQHRREMGRHAHWHATDDQPVNDRAVGQSVRITLARGSMWRLEAPNRLVIEFGEERTGERPKIATRVYMKLTPQ